MAKSELAHNTLPADISRVGVTGMWQPQRVSIAMDKLLQACDKTTVVLEWRDET